MYKRNPIRILCLFAAALLYLLPNAAYAINCFSNDEQKIALMYDIYVRAGKEPYVKTPKVTSVEPLVNMHGEIIALQNFEKCWFERPACNAPASYAPVVIGASVSYDTLKEHYSKDTKAIIYECFMKIGAAYKYKNKYNQRR